MSAPLAGQPQGGAGPDPAAPPGPGEPPGGQPPADGAPPAPPWGSDEQFDPVRAWALIQNLRGEVAQARTDRDGYKTKVDEHTRAGQSETERLTGDRDTYKNRAETADGRLTRLDVGLAKGLTPTQCARLVGTTDA
ncbi:MAG: hypothetical protein ACT4RN_17570 [Pseudonocardia sp.]